MVLRPKRDTRKDGRLVIVGESQRFFYGHSLKSINEWIIDQLTIDGNQIVEIWEARKTPFVNNLKKVKLLERYK